MMLPSCSTSTSPATLSSPTQDAFSKADLLGFQTNAAYSCLVADILLYNPGEMRTDKGSHSYILQSSGTMLEEQVLHTAHMMNLAVMTALHSQRLIVVLEAAEGTLSADLAERYPDSFEQSVRHSIPNLHFLWGYDNQGHSIDTLYTGYKNAKTALKLCRDSHGTITRNCFQLSILQKVHSLLSADAETVAMANTILKTVLAYDREKDTAFLQALKTYIETNYNVSETARIMHLHRQSLLYRLDKLEALCQLSLKEHEDLFILEICMMILENHT